MSAMSTMSTMSALSASRHAVSRRSLRLLVLLAALLGTGLAVDSGNAEAPDEGNRHQVCWIIPTIHCDDPQGDCAYRSTNEPCHFCDGPFMLLTACIYKPDSRCVQTTRVIFCGKRFRGHCDASGHCLGDHWEGYCNVGVCHFGAA